MGWRKIAEDKLAEKEAPPELPKLPPMPVPKKAEAVKPKEVYEVVARIPTQEIRRYEREDGTIVNYITVEEWQLMKMTMEVNAGLE